jgi:GntR family transcriptional repressor for pyruvate dehydrogenase complex
VTDEISVARQQDRGSGGYDRVIAFMRQQLKTGRLKAGDRLLPERELAAALGVSRPVVREALRTLAAIGAVDIRPGHGTIVTRPDFSIVGDFFSLALAQEPNVIDDVMEVRIAIERHAVRLACRRASENDMARLTNVYQEIVESLDDDVAGWRADFEFHRALVAAARSPTLSGVYDAISDLLRTSLRERRQHIREIEGMASFLVDHHGKLLNALLEREEAAADRLLVEHFEIGAELRRQANLNAAGRGASAQRAKSIAMPASAAGERLP